jgi:outer membrane protein assembly factor BamB
MDAMPDRIILLSLVLLCGPAAADDWPEIMGPKRRGISKETGWNMDWNAKEPPVSWKISVGAGASSCAVAGGRVYTMGGSPAGTESVLCLDAETGEELWRQTYECEFDKRSWTGGPAATPVIDEDRVYTLSFRGQLFCWNADDGARVWELHLEKSFKGIMPHWGWAGSPLVVGNMLVIEPGGNGSSRAAVDKLTGKVFWQRGTDPAAYASPIIFSGPEMRGVALFNVNGLVGINPRDGTELFRQEWKTRFDVNAAIPVHRDGKFFIGSAYRSGIALLDPKSGTVWQNKNIMIQFQSPVLFGDQLYFVSGENSATAVLQCLDWATGDVKWSAPAGRERGHLIVAADKLIVITQQGELILAGASPDSYAEFGRLQALPAEVYAAPAFSDGRLFLRNNAGTLLCLDLRP